MTDQKRNFLQETAFEEDVTIDEYQEDYWKTDESKRKVAQQFSQWMKDRKN